ncbi:MAG: TadE/TadG family type IV pilus assembly protein [Magnetospiraceae bacterium]
MAIFQKRIGGTPNQPDDKRSFWRDTVGATAVEFAIVAPIVLLVIFALIDFGRLFWYRASLQYMTTEVMRDAIAEYNRVYWNAYGSDPGTARSNLDAFVATWEPNLETDAEGGFLSIVAQGADYDADTEAGTGDFTGCHYLVIRGSYDFEFIFPLPVGDQDLKSYARAPMVKSDPTGSCQ